VSEPRPRLLLLGRTGQVGCELEHTLAPLGVLVALGRAELDLYNVAATRERIRELRPDVIVNAAAYTAVDRAESDAAAAFGLNARTPGVLAEEAERLGALLVHFSTDYVFDGTKASPYTEQDEPNPLNVYGASKLEGERAIQQIAERHIILRTSWVYGLRGSNFLLTMLRLFRERQQVSVVSDQVGTPTWCRSIAETTARILALAGDGGASPGGVYHLSAGGQTTWYGFATAIQRALPATQRATSLEPITTEQHPVAAVRPRYSVLANDRIRKTFRVSLASWDSQLEAVLSELRITSAVTAPGQ
jgi:dTDP-4-dehydrorhamnose reductase